MGNKVGKSVECIVDSRLNAKEIHPQTLLRFAATIAYRSTQPFAHAIVAASEELQGTKVVDVVQEFSETPDIGMTGLIVKNSQHSTRFYLGEKDYVLRGLKKTEANADRRAKEQERAGRKLWYIANSDRILGYLVLTTTTA